MHSLNAASENGASLRRLATEMQELLQRLPRTFQAQAEQGEPPAASEPFEPEAFNEESQPWYDWPTVRPPWLEEEGWVVDALE